VGGRAKDDDDFPFMGRLRTCSNRFFEEESAAAAAAAAAGSSEDESEAESDAESDSGAESDAAGFAGARDPAPADWLEGRKGLVKAADALAQWGSRARGGATGVEMPVSRAQFWECFESLGGAPVFGTGRRMPKELCPKLIGQLLVAYQGSAADVGAFLRADGMQTLMQLVQQCCPCHRPGCAP